MPPQNFRIVVKFDKDGFHYEWLTADNCLDMIRRHFPQLASCFHPRLPRFQVPVQFNRHRRKYEPVIDLSPLNIDRIFAILRIFGWSGNLAYGVYEGETEPDWHWSTHVFAHPRGLP